MGTLTQQVIHHLQQIERADDPQQIIRQAADLLGKSVSSSYISGYDDIDAEQITAAEGEQMKQALVRIVQSSPDPELLRSAVFALAKSYDPALKDLYIAHLQTSLSRLKDQNALVFQLLIALDNIHENVFESDEHGRTSQGALNIEKNIRQSQNYLLQHDIIVP